jgi:hypothetical protein
LIINLLVKSLLAVGNQTIGGRAVGTWWEAIVLIEELSGNVFIEFFVTVLQ